jgi:RimJ/RimL family protein N-acetyltransferase
MMGAVRSLVTRLFSPKFWFGTFSYVIVANDTEDILRQVIPSPRMQFQFFHYGKGLRKEKALLKELCTRIPGAFRGAAWRVERYGGLVVVAREVGTGEIAACREFSTRTPGNIIHLGQDELYLRTAYTIPEYRGMSLQAITLQEGIQQLERMGVRKKTAVALIAPSNEASLRGLAKVGVRPCGWVVERRFFHVIHVFRGVYRNQDFARLELAL